MMTKSQRAMVEKILDRCLEMQYGSSCCRNYEIKDAKVTEPDGKPNEFGYVYRDAFMVLETGYKGDEGTMGAIFGRDRRNMVIGPKGKVTLLNAKSGKYVKGFSKALYTPVN